MRALATVLLKGAAMGVAEIIPGISGGTIALITGIYDRLVAAIAALHPRPLGHLPYLHHRAHRTAFIEELRSMDIGFLITLGLGMAAMVIILARAIERLFELAPGATYAFFAGLIGASAIILYKEVQIDTPLRIALAIVAAALAFILSGLAADGLGHSLPVLFIAGAIAITALVLPGVSGSFLLLAMGQYEYMLGVLNDFVDTVHGLLTGGASLGTLGDTGVPVGVFLTGAVLGLVTIAHVVNYALRRARELTLIVLISLMVGSLRVPGEEVIDTYQPGLRWLSIIMVAGLVGVGAILLLDYYTDDLAY